MDTVISWLGSDESSLRGENRTKYRAKRQSSYQASGAPNSSGNTMLDKVTVSSLSRDSSPTFEDNKIRRRCNAEDRKDYVLGTINKYKKDKSFSMKQRSALRSASKAMSDCKCWVGANDKGLMSFQRFGCHRQYCDTCQVIEHQPRRRMELEYILKKILKIDGGRTVERVGGAVLSRTFFVTLTSQHIHGRGYEEEVKVQRNAWSKTTQSAWYKREVDGVWRVEEVTARYDLIDGEQKKIFNPHNHTIIRTKRMMTAARFKEEMEPVWRARGGGHIDVKVADVGKGSNIKLELTKYLTKTWDVDGPLLAELIAGLRGRRLVNKAGVFRKWAKEAKEAKENEEIKKDFVEKYPSPVNPRTGEVVSLTKVSFGIRYLYDKATQEGCWNSQWLLMFIRWLAKAEKYGPEGHYDWEKIKDEVGIFALVKPSSNLIN